MMEADGIPFEAGSEYHWEEPVDGPCLPWPQPSVLYSLGREAFCGAVSKINSSSREARNIFVPDYYCLIVTGHFEKEGYRLRRYNDNPSRSYPDWDSLDNVGAGDIVLAVNFFGAREGGLWNEWHRNNKHAYLIEDHSHDPFSGWARNSNADYAFASIRKTFPVPDGGILWSPQDRPLPDELTDGNWLGSSLKLASMIIKKDYLAGNADRSRKLRSYYRELQIRGERILQYSGDKVISLWSRFIIEDGYPVQWRQDRERNVSKLYRIIDGIDKVEPLFTTWPEGNCPFNAILLFPSESIKNCCNNYLIEKNIYVTTHWPQGANSSPTSFDLSNRVITVPVDQRYDEADIHIIAGIIAEALDKCNT